MFSSSSRTPGTSVPYFSQLKKHHNTEMLFDLYYPEIDQNQFERQDWCNTVNGDSLTEDLTPSMPEPQYLGFVLSTYIDSDYAGNTITRRSGKGFLVYRNSALNYWMSKKQNFIETSFFGSEFCVMKVVTEYIRDWDLNWEWWASHARNLPTFMGIISRCNLST